MGILHINHMIETVKTSGSSPFGAPSKDEIQRFKSEFLRLGKGLYAVKLVQFAIAQGATNIKVTNTLTRFELSFDGLATTPDKLTDLYSRFLCRDGIAVRDPLWHLAAGLFAACHEEPSQVRFESLSEREAYRYVWDEQGLKQEKAEKFHDIWNNRITIFRTFSDILDLAKEELAETLGLEPKEDSVEVQAIRRYCLFAPCEVWVNGQLLPAPSFGQDVPLECRDSQDLVAGRFASRHLLVDMLVAAESGEPACLGIPESNASLNLWSPDSLAPRQRAWMGVMAGLLQESEVIFVEDGARLDTYRCELPCPGLLAVLSCEMIPKDLSGFKLLPGVDFDFHQLLLAKHARRLAEDLDFNDGKFPSQLQRRITSALERTAKRDVRSR